MSQKREEYKGHIIELRAHGIDEFGMREIEPKTGHKSEHEPQLELLIDDTRVQYGQLPDGKYFLEKYAYDWRDDLMDLARGFIDYHIKSNVIQGKSKKYEDDPKSKEEQ